MSPNSDPRQREAAGTAQKTMGMLIIEGQGPGVEPHHQESRL